MEAFIEYSSIVRKSYSRVGSLHKAPIDIHQPFRKTSSTNELLEVMDKRKI